MGTETNIVPTFLNATVSTLVKLNNPLMGTETNFAYVCVPVAVLIRLN